MDKPAMIQTPVSSPDLRVTEEMITSLVSIGGYTHDLFQTVGSAPLMGQGVLLLAGGLAEQSGALDHAVALVGLEDVRFHKMVVPDMVISLQLQRLSSRPASSGRRIETYAWSVVDEAGDLVLETTAVMLTNPPEGNPAP
jgi:hypothetical protein